jgi:hypothetical protein
MVDGQTVLQRHLLQEGDSDPDAEVNAASITLNSFKDSDDSSIIPR